MSVVFLDCIDAVLLTSPFSRLSGQPLSSSALYILQVATESLTLMNLVETHGIWGGKYLANGERAVAIGNEDHRRGLPFRPDASPTEKSGGLVVVDQWVFSHEQMNHEKEVEVAIVNPVIWWSQSVRVDTMAFHNLILVLDDIATEITRFVLIPSCPVEGDGDCSDDRQQTTRHGSNAAVACLVMNSGALGAASVLEPGPNALSQPYFNLRLGVATSK